jgi:hypothetical protein
MRPPGLVYAVDENPPALRLALLGVQYAIMSSIYLVLVAIILRHAGQVSKPASLRWELLALDLRLAQRSSAWRASLTSETGGVEDGGRNTRAGYDNP